MAKSKYLHIRIQPKLLELVKEASRRRNQSTSLYLRKALLKLLREDKKMDDIMEKYK
jgi:hypothetical protein